MVNSLGIVYLKKDAEIFSKSKIELKNILALSPDSHNILKHKYKKIFTPSKFDKTFQLTSKLICYEKLLK